MEELLRDVTKRLNVIIPLVIDEQIRVGRVKKGDLLLLLTSCGLSTGDIASIVGGRTKDIAHCGRLEVDLDSMKEDARQKPENKTDQQQTAPDFCSVDKSTFIA